KTLALRLFPLDARLPRVLHAEDAPGAGQRTAQRRRIIEIALGDVDAVARQRRRPLALRLARQAAQTEAAALQRLRDRAALIACHSGDENRSIVHSFVLVKYLVDFVVRLVKRHVLAGALRKSSFRPAPERFRRTPNARSRTRRPIES